MISSSKKEKKPSQFEQLCLQFIRPPRANYTTFSLGPESFPVGNKLVKRTDLQLKNKRGLTLQCSFYQIPSDNCCRLECMAALNILLENGFLVFSFDFSGSGLSEGEYVSLGYYESEVVFFYKQLGRRDCSRVFAKTINGIYLWGRSMGAVTALIYSSRDPTIKGVIADSAFSNLKKLALEIAQRKVFLPKFILSAALHFVRKKIMKMAKFNIKDIDLPKFVKKSQMPVLLVASKEDSFVKCHHSQLIMKPYAGPKKLVWTQGEHNASRPVFFYEDIVKDFLLKVAEGKFNEGLVKKPSLGKKEVKKKIKDDMDKKKKKKDNDSETMETLEDLLNLKPEHKNIANNFEFNLAESVMLLQPDYLKKNDEHKIKMMNQMNLHANTPQKNLYMVEHHKNSLGVLGVPMQEKPMPRTPPPKLFPHNINYYPPTKQNFGVAPMPQYNIPIGYKKPEGNMPFKYIVKKY